MSATTGLAEMRRLHQPGRCLFCSQAIPVGRSTCASRECARAYVRAWHRDAKVRRHEYETGAAMLPITVEARPTVLASASPAPKSWPIGSSYLPGAAPWFAGTPPQQPRVAPKPVPLEEQDAHPALRYEPVRARAPSAECKPEQAMRVARLRGEVNAATLQEALAATRSAAHQLLCRLAAEGRLKRMEMGLYRVADAVDALEELA